MSMRLAIALGLGVAFLSVLNPNLSLWAQEVIPPPSPTIVPGGPYPAHVDGGFVPADILLQEADARRPPTAEGWVVSERPLPWTVEIDPARRHYWLVDYPMRLREYDSQIRLARAEVDSWHRRLHVYRYFNKAGALFITYENAYLTLLQAAENLRNLRFARTLFLREHYLEQRDQPAELIVAEHIVPAATDRAP